MSVPTVPCCNNMIDPALPDFQEQCRLACDPPDGDTCCGVLPLESLDPSSYGDACTEACTAPTLDCCGTQVSTGQSKEDFQLACRTVCDGGDDTDKCCGFKVPSGLTVVNYASECTQKCDGPECFSSANTVEVKGKGVVSMENLQIGDHVRAGNDQYSRVISFIHLDRELEADFLQIHAKGMTTAPLEVTQDHMLYVNGAFFPVAAAKVKAGDVLVGNNNANTTFLVSEIKSVKRRGVYAPLTESGDLVVTGALASSYAAVRAYTPINQHAEAHAFFSIRRLVCAYDFEICKSETYTDDGHPHWLSSTVHFAQQTRNSAPAQIFASVVALPMIASAYTLEQAILCSPILVVAGILLMVGLVKKKIDKASSKVNTVA